jgi:hypothetical protein
MPAVVIQALIECLSVTVTIACGVTCDRFARA